VRAQDRYLPLGSNASRAATPRGRSGGGKEEVRMPLSTKSLVVIAIVALLAALGCSWYLATHGQPPSNGSWARRTRRCLG
jgi:hypothetical protein